MKKFFKKNWFLGLILLLAAFFRLYRLGKLPPSLDWDETALGYNAFCLLKTARDEYGQFLPFVFRSFGDYKPGLYIYLSLPSVLVFGLTEFAIRLPSALIGIATVWLVYQTSFNLFGQKRLARFASLILAFSPWHLHFSRGAWEANLALFLILAGINSFLMIRKKTQPWLLFSSLSFGLAILAYQGSKMMTPLIILGLLISFKKRLKTLAKKQLVLGAILFLIISFPIIFTSAKDASGRLKVMSVFSYRRPVEEVEQILSQDKNNQLYFNFFHSQALAFFQGILGRYFNHFSGRFLLFEGDWSSQRHSAPYLGMAYYLDFLFLILGLVYLVRKKSTAKGFLGYWLLVSPLPAALSRDAIQGVRSLQMVLPLAIIAGVGADQVYLWLKAQKRILGISLAFLLIMAYCWCFILYLDLYYLHYPIKSSEFWQYGYKQVVNFIYPIKDRYSRIIFTQKWGQPYIYWLFYTQYPPRAYQNQAKLTENPYGDVGQVEKIDNLEFRNIYWPADRNLKKTLFIGGRYELPLKDIEPGQARILTEIKFLNGEVAFRVVETL